jgi:hypothetical protein
MIHTLPLNDLKEHEESSSCECTPTMIEVNGEFIFSHNSYDGRELIEQGFQKDLKMNGITTRDGEELYECDVIETIQGHKFICINAFGIKTNIMDEKGDLFDLEYFMSPNIWRIGNLFKNPELRNLFKREIKA